eukprot:gene4508-6172_t
MGPGSGAKLLHSLTVTAPGQPPQQVPLAGTLTIGRIPPAGLVLPFPEVSRRHAQIALAGGTAVVSDLGSTNGVWVNGAQITGPTVLEPGTQMRIGHVVLVYAAEPEPETMIAAAPAARPPGGTAQGDGGRLDDPALTAAGLPGGQS